MSGITFNGLASGLDTGSMIDRLIELERAGATTLSRRQSDLSAQKTIIGSLSSALGALGTAARGMDLDSEVRPRGVTVSDTRVSVAVSSAASTTAHELRVKALATAKVTQSRSFASTGPGALGTGGVNITVGGVTKAVAWTASDSLASIADKINAAGAGVSASVLDVDGTTHRLVVTANDTGTAAAPTFVDTGDGLDLAVAGNVKVPAANAVISVDGIDVTRGKNVIADALPGVTLTLNSLHLATEPDAKATVALDNKALNDKVKAIVTAYNSVNTALHVQLDFTGTTKGSNTLFGDSSLRQLQGALARIASSAYGSSNLSALGLTRDKTGAMALDETKLAAALAADPNAVSSLFVTNGFATAVGDLANQYTTAGTGIFATKTQSLTSRSTALQQQIDRINRNADSMQTRLEKQFGALEQAMSQLQSQSNAFAAMLSR